MSDIAIVPTQSVEGTTFDFAVKANDVLLDEGLYTATVISLFTDRRVSKEELPALQDQRGWWHDAIAEIPDDKWGSKLWLLEREVKSNVVLTRAVEYANEALAWMLEDEIAATIDVVASYTLKGFLAVEVSIVKPNGEKLNYAFDSQWKAEGNRNGF